MFVWEDTIHAEKVVYKVSGSRIIGVSRPTCPEMCIPYFTSEAKNLKPNEFIVIDDRPEGSGLVFLPTDDKPRPFSAF